MSNFIKIVENMKKNPKCVPYCVELKLFMDLGDLMRTHFVDVIVVLARPSLIS